MIGSALQAVGNHLVLEMVVKGVLLSGLVVGAAWAVRRGSAATRHSVWSVGLVSLLILPIALVTIPEWHVPGLGLTQAAEATSVSSDLAQHGAAVLPASDRPAPEVTPVAGRDGMAQVPIEPSPGLLQRGGLLLTILYAAGVLLMLAGVARGVGRMIMITRYGATPAEGRETDFAEACARRMGLRRRPRVLVTHWTAVPVTWGLLRPVILLPPGMEFWSEERTRVAIRHELAHVKRWDFLWKIFADVAVAFHWVNPLAWYARRSACLEGERAADNAVLCEGTASTDYAEHLVEIARTTPGASGPDGGKTGVPQLRTRVEDILAGAVRRNPAGGVPTFAAGAVVLALSMGIAGASFVAPPAAPASLSDVWALTESRSPLAMAALLDQLANGPADQRAVAALSLGERRDSRGREALVAALRDPSPPVREHAAVALVNMGGRELVTHVLPLLRDSVTDVRSVTTWVLGQLGGEEAADALYNVVRHEPDEHTRSMATAALTRITEVDVVPRLTSLLNKVEGHTRLDVVIALGATGDPRVIPVLHDLVKHDPDAETRLVAVRSLGDMDDPGRVAVWLDAMRDPYWRVRNHALLFLSEIKSDAARTAVLRALNDPQHQVRLNAAWALEGRI